VKYSDPEREKKLKRNEEIEIERNLQRKKPLSRNTM